ncbi:TetR/AcrR family transcriptional regulator [Beijerinckia mobilis]|uniref:TetR/AcrR family transcriptional regulator n=1 Tax=Beijerinckia mobilis TaxID=231434 RepID=UPI00055754E3|nr:TetR/AcrR family transcriptional regulator [Beijerinckia mobilis]
MASQKSSASTTATVVTRAATGAVAPKRERGRSRVAAILEAGAEVFAEKGYGGATMTEIAARSKTAIGSLYRFFPTKEALADALLTRYGDLMTERLAAIEARASGLSPSQLADVLVDFMLDMSADRAIALPLIEVTQEAEEKRAHIRGAIRRGLASILTVLDTGITQAEAEGLAVMLLYLLKAVPQLACNGSEVDEPLIARIRALVSLYLVNELPHAQRLANDAS